MSITEFLLARIDEDEAEARNASHQKIAGPFHGNWRADSLHLVSMERADAIHIARHDPARVLRECEAKRAIIGSHASCTAMTAKEQEPGVKLVGAGMVQGLDLALQSLAAVYADHQDYQPEWAPQQ